MVAALSPELRYVIWAAVVLLATAVLLVAAKAGRRLIQRPRQETGGDLTWERMEKMRGDGLIDEDEFKVLRRNALGLPLDSPAENADSNSRCEADRVDENRRESGDDDVTKD